MRRAEVIRALQPAVLAGERTGRGERYDREWAQHLAQRDGELLRARYPLVWRWRTVADPCCPAPARIAHPLAARAGDRCRAIRRGRNGNVLIEFIDGYRVVAPRHATRRAS